MNRLTITTIDRIIELMSLLSESDKHTPLRLANIGYDIYKESGLKEYRHMTVGQFLSTIAGYENIPRKLIRIVDALEATTPLLSYPMTSTGGTDLASDTNTVKTLPSNSNMSFFNQASEVIETLLTAMSTLKDSDKDNAERIKLSFFKGVDYTEIGAATDISRERVRQVCKELMSVLMNGKVRKELAVEYCVDQSFIDEAHRVAASIENQTIDFVKSNFGDIEKPKFQFIIKAMGLKTLVVGDKELVVKKDRSYSQLTA